MQETNICPRQINICIDFGGVLSIHDRAESRAGEHISTAINMPDALNILRELKQQNKNVRLYLLSFAGKTRAQETKAALEKECPDIFERMFFVKNKKDKKTICKYLGAHIMIDDTVEILKDITGECKCILFTGDPTFPVETLSASEADILIFDNWSKIQEFVTSFTPSALIPDTTININKVLYNLI